MDNLYKCINQEGEMVLRVTKILYRAEIKKLNCSKSRKQQDDPGPQFGSITKTLTDSGFIIANWGLLARANKSKIKKWYKKQNTIKLSSNKTTQFNYSPTFPLFDDFMQCRLFHVNTLLKWLKLFFVKEMKTPFKTIKIMQKSLDHPFCCNKKSNSISILSSVAIIYYWPRKNTFAIPGAQHLIQQ